MTKIDGRDKRTAARQLDESMRRLQTDHIDLLHFMKSSARPTRRGFSAQAGASKPRWRRNKPGKIRYIGFTGHKVPQCTCRCWKPVSAISLTRRVQMPAQCLWTPTTTVRKRYASVAQAQNWRSGDEPMGDHIILESKTASAVECLHYALSLPTSVVITGCDSLPSCSRPLVLLAVSSRRVRTDCRPAGEDCQCCAGWCV